jgi:hypothetical protein
MQDQQQGEGRAEIYTYTSTSSVYACGFSVSRRAANSRAAPAAPNHTATLCLAKAAEHPVLDLPAQSSILQQSCSVP